ncbi:MAG: hypothetical protein NTU62_07035 [Spirochaetes bacterium]|nr:hypothetical protein [Spirochaetota bacterium]
MPREDAVLAVAYLGVVLVVAHDEDLGIQQPLVVQAVVPPGLLAQLGGLVDGLQVQGRVDPPEVALVEVARGGGLAPEVGSRALGAAKDAAEGDDLLLADLRVQGFDLLAVGVQVGPALHRHIEHVVKGQRAVLLQQELAEFRLGFRGRVHLLQ